MLKVDWEPGAAYTLAVDSLAMTDIYGLQTKPLKVDFNVRKMEEYGNIVFNIPAVRDSAIVELLDGTDKVVLHTPVKSHRAELLNLLPGKYYARLFIDRNGNGKYDTGNYDMHLQPEETVYYPGAINLKKNWDVEQTWDIYATPIDKQQFRQLPQVRQQNLFSFFSPKICTFHKGALPLHSQKPTTLMPRWRNW